MSRNVAPLLSFDARGQLGKTLVYSRWKGRPYTRRYVIPSNPRSEEQTKTRTVFATLSRIWSYLPGGSVDAWQLYADNSNITARNGFAKLNLSQLRTATDLSNFLLSPSAGGGLAAQDVDVTPTSGGFDVTLTAPVLPTGWTIARASALAIEDFDPHDEVTPIVRSASVTEGPWTLSIDGLEDVTSAVVGGWFEFTKPTGSRCFGASLQEIASPL